MRKRHIIEKSSEEEQAIPVEEEIATDYMKAWSKSIIFREMH